MAEKVRIGFVGVGTMGQAAHLRNYASLPDCEVVAISELRPHLGAEVARHYGIPNVYATAQEMLAAEKLDGIVASQPFNHHGSIVPPLYEYGVPVFTEKPLASSIKVGEQILKALSASGTWHMVGYNKRSDPAIAYAKRAIDQFKANGEIGKLTYVRILMPAGDWIANSFRGLINSSESVPHIEPDEPKSWDDPYFKFVNYYIHQVNMMRYLLGESYRITFADPSGVILAVESESGICGVIEMSPYQTTIDWQEQILVSFERGWIKAELVAPVSVNRAGTVSVFTDPGKGATPTTITPTLPMNSSMYEQAINFIRAIRGEIPPMCTAQEALQDLVNAQEYIDLTEAHNAR